MKALPGLLIEYLITGSGAVFAIWAAWSFGIIVIPDWFQPETMKPVTVAMLIPNIYLAGMLVDFVSKALTNVLAGFLDDFWHPRCGDPLRSVLPGGFKWLIPAGPKKYDASLSTAQIYEKSERLSEQFEMRSSRDRIARGAFANLLLLTIFIGMGAGTSVAITSLHVAGATCLTVVVFLMWRRFKRLSSRWKYEASIALSDDR